MELAEARQKSSIAATRHGLRFITVWSMLPTGTGGW